MQSRMLESKLGGCSSVRSTVTFGVLKWFRLSPLGEGPGRALTRFFAKHTPLLGILPLFFISLESPVNNNAEFSPSWCTPVLYVLSPRRLRKILHQETSFAVDVEL